MFFLVECPIQSPKLATIEAMKMQTTLYAPVDGLVDKVAVNVGENVESKDLLFKLK